MIKKFNEYITESIRDKMTPKSKEELDAIREKSLKSYEWRKKSAINSMNNLTKKLNVKTKKIDSGEILDDDAYFSVEFKYNDITYHITIKPFENNVNVGFYNIKGVGDWEDIEFVEDSSYYIHQWIDSNEWRRKNNVEYK